MSDRPHSLALVTGASSGIGLEIARLLAARGVHLVLAARRIDRLEALATELRGRHGIQAEALAVDLESPAAARELFERVTAGGREVDILINNAGFGAFGPSLDVPWDRQAAELQVNANALTELCWRFGRHMRAHGRPAHVLNVASIAAWQPVPGFAVYAATKAYVRHFSEALAWELRGTNVAVTCVSPGGTWSEFSAVAGHHLGRMARASMMSSERVAQLALRAMDARKPSIVTGIANALACWLSARVPRRWAMWGASQAMGAPTRLEGPSRE